MKKIMLLVVVLLLASTTTLSAKVIKDAKGNYTFSFAKKDSVDSGKTFTDSKGVVSKVWISLNGKLYTWRVSKSGRNYKMYLK